MLAALHSVLQASLHRRGGDRPGYPNPSARATLIVIHVAPCEGNEGPAYPTPAALAGLAVFCLALCERSGVPGNLSPPAHLPCERGGCQLRETSGGPSEYGAEQSWRAAGSPFLRREGG